MGPSARVPEVNATPEVRTRSGPLTTRTVTTTTGLGELEPLWEALLLEAPEATPFLTHAWVASWWQTFGDGQELAVVVVEDQEGPVAIAPFARAKRRLGPLSWRTLELIGTGPLRFLGMGLSDRAGFLLGRCPAEGAQAVLGWLAAERDSWDVADLRFVPQESATAVALGAHLADLGLETLTTPCSESPFLPLTGSYAEYLASRGRNFRKGLVRKRARLEESGPVGIDLEAAVNDPLAALAAAREVSTGSWKAHAGSALLLHPNVYRFFETLVPRMAARGSLYLALLRVGTRPAAHELGFRMGGKLWSYDSCFHRDFGSGSPGVVLTAALLELAFSQGLSEYDFLRGDEGYKVAWRTESRYEIQAAIGSGSPLAAAALALAYRGKWALKRSPFLVAAQSAAAGLANRFHLRSGA